MSARLAVAGLGCQLPGAPGPSALWDVLVSGRDVLRRVPRERFDVEALASTLPNRVAQSPRAGLIDTVELKLAGLRLPPLQLEQLHQMEKAALAAMFQALSDAGVTPGSDLGKRTQVIVGATGLGPDPKTDQRRRIYRFELAERIGASVKHVVRDRADEFSQLIDDAFDEAAPPVILDSLATSASLVAGRLCNAFDLQGGHLVVDAGSASALAALDLAAGRLADGTCDMALVSGISPLVSAARVLGLLQSVGFEDAPPPGEGCVALVLVRESDSAGLRQPHALLEAIGGHAVVGTGPEALREAVALTASTVLRRAGLDPGSVDCIERQDTGVKVLDEAARRALRDAYQRTDGAASVTSSTPLVGYQDAAAGLVGVLKACLALERGTWAGDDPSPITYAVVSDAGTAPMTYQALLSRPDSVALPRPTRPPRRSLAEEGVAIVGVGVVAPGAVNTTTFWRNTLGSVDAIQDLPTERWDVDRFVSGNAELRNLLRTRLAGTVDMQSVLERAATLVGKSEEDLEPGSALALIACSEALDDARIHADANVANRVGVILGQLPIRTWETQAEVRVLFLEYLQRASDVLRQAGVGESSVQRIRAHAVAQFDAAFPDRRGIDPAIFSGITAPALVADTHQFRGEVLSIDAACASSLAALQIGVDRLLNGDLDVVVAGGVAFNLLPEYYIGLGMLGVLSRFGAAPFHVGADGFVPAEGAGAVVLKRLSDARQAEDQVYGVIRGIGASSDGRGPSIFLPNTEAQQRAMLQALSGAGLDPEQIDLVEAHGVGTEAGDTAESASYRAVYGQRNRTLPLYVGTSKEQIGYLSCAAPAVSLVRVALALREQILPTGALGEDGQAVMLPQESVRLIRSAREWAVPPFRRRRAAISGIGLGGINHHVVVEEPDPTLRSRSSVPSRAALPSRTQRANRWTTDMLPVALRVPHPTASLDGAHILLIRDTGHIWVEVARALEARRARVTALDPAAPLDPLATAHLDGIIDLTELRLGGAPRTYSADEVLAVSTRTFDLLRAVYSHLEARPVGGGWYAAAVSLGGDLGSSNCVDPSGARFVGMTRALKRELPSLTCKVVDFAAETADSTLANALLDELESGDPDVAVAYQSGRRFVPRLRLVPEPEEAQPVWLPEGTRCVISGGGRGVLFDCALALRRLGAKVVVSGRTQTPSPDAPWLALDDRAFEDYRRAQMLEAWRRERVTPVQFQAAFGKIERQRELHRNLELARGLGLALDYEVCDVTDANAVERLVAATRARWGGIDVVVHGAMVEHSAPLIQKPSNLIAQTFATKVGGLINLLDALGDEQPRLICFGSVAGLFGNAGQTDYAAADTLMSAILSSRYQSPRGSTTISWPAWRQVGAAARDADLEARLQSAGVTLMWPDEGTYWFLQHVASASSAPTAVLDENMLQRWAWDAGASVRPELDDAGHPLVAGRWPMVDQVEYEPGGEVVVRRRLDPAADRFLLQHRLHGVPTLPFAFGCEMLAEAALLAQPGYRVDALLEIRVESPLKHFALKPVDVTTRVTTLDASASDDTRLVEIVIASDLRVGERVAADARVHYRARALLTRQRSAPSTVDILHSDDAPDGEEGFVHARSFFHLMKDPILLGPAFDRAAWLRVGANRVDGVVQPRRERDAVRRTSSPQFAIDPFGLDAALQIAASWDGYRHGWLSVPMTVARLQVGRPWRTADPLRIVARVAAAASDEITYDIDAVHDSDGASCFRIEGLHQRRFARRTTEREGE